MNAAQICPVQRHPCQHPCLCDGYCDLSTAPLTTESDTGHKVAHGRRIEYLGRAAAEPVLGELPAIAFPDVRSLIVDFWLALVDLCFWPLVAGFVLGLGYGAGRFFNFF